MGDDGRAAVHAQRQTPPAKALRVLIADDHERVRSGMRRLLAALPDVEVVGLATDGAEAVALAREPRPEVVLMDAAMPGIGGIEATRRIVAADPSVRVVILTAFAGTERRAADAGAVAHLLKDSAPGEVVSVLRRVAAAGRAR